MNRQSQPFITVVTPVYNGEKYLAECIESVLAQSYENWEHVIVNNCSTDRTLEVAEHYARKDKRIRVHSNTEFLGVIQNLNNTLRRISPDSKYCKPVLADDWIFPECLWEMVKVAESNPSVGIVGAYRLDDRWVKLDGLPYPSTVVPGRKICSLVLLGEVYVFGSPNSVLYRSDIVRNRRVFFNELHTYADVEACFEVLQNRDFGFVHQVLTFTRRHKESVTGSLRDFNPYPLTELYLLQEYGPLYLTREQLKQRLKETLDGYYRFLAKSVLQFRGKKFWEFHRRGLRELGHSLSLRKLMGAYCSELVKPARILLRSVEEQTYFQRKSREKETS